MALLFRETDDQGLVVPICRAAWEFHVFIQVDQLLPLVGDGLASREVAEYLIVDQLLMFELGGHLLQWDIFLLIQDNFRKRVPFVFRSKPARVVPDPPGVLSQESGVRLLGPIRLEIEQRCRECQAIDRALLLVLEVLPHLVARRGRFFDLPLLLELTLEPSPLLILHLLDLGLERLLDNLACRADVTGGWFLQRLAWRLKACLRVECARLSELQFDRHCWHRMCGLSPELIYVWDSLRMQLL